MNDDPLGIARALGDALDAVGARWAIGGSVAASVHGVPRTTQDLDLVVALAARQATAFAAAASGFFVDGFVAFHAATMTKVDLFPAVGRFERNQLDRASVVHGVSVVSPEDAVLAKLRWYRVGGEVSDRQWRDVLGVLSVQGERLDREHLRRWADELGVADLLARALADGSGGF